MNPPRPRPPRYVAYSTLTREPVLSGVSAAALLGRTRDMPALGFDNRFVEILDCGVDGPDASTVDLRLDDARVLYRTMFRGVGTPGQPGYPALALRHVDPPGIPPDTALAIAQGLSTLVDRAETAGLEAIAAILRGALAALKAGIDDDAPAA